ncbi:MAG: hypothetical protein ACXVEE_23215 [Polyangiales bacterium]
MRKRFRPGQWPTHPRLWDIDLEAVLEDVRNLFAYVREGEAAPFDSHRAMVALDVAATAARARERLARSQPVPPYELAALVGVHRSRIYQMVRTRGLRLVPGGIAPDSARALFEMPHVTAPPTAHRLWIEPSFAGSDGSRWGLIQLFMKDVLRPLQVPRGTTWGFSARAVELRVPATARLSDEAAEVLRQRVLAHLETVDARKFWSSDERGEVARA